MVPILFKSDSIEDPKVINARFALDATRAHQAGLKNHTPGYIVFEIMHMEDPMKNL